MTALAVVEQRGCGELPGMRVLVAIHAAGKLDFEFRGRARGQMAFGAADFGMRALERIRAGGVVLHGEG